MFEIFLSLLSPLYVLIISDLRENVKQNFAQKIVKNLFKLYIDTRNSAQAQPLSGRQLYHISARLSIGKCNKKQVATLCNLSIDYFPFLCLVSFNV